MNDQLCIRTDADASIGSGHAMRCIALAEAWKRQGGRATFYSTSLPSSILKRLRGEGIDTVRIEASPGSADDAEETAGKSKASWTVVDSRNLGPGYVSALCTRGARVLWWDDLGSSERIDAELVLNQNIHARSELYPSASGGLLLGTKYACLREEFLLGPRTMGNDLFVSFGGWPPPDALTMVAEALNGLDDRGLEVTVIGGHRQTGAPSPFTGKVKLVDEPPDMSDLMRESFLAISAGGSTCWELCFMGIPQILFVLSDDQAQVASGLHDAGCAINMGESTHERAAELASHLENLIEDKHRRLAMSERCRAIVDGQGADRVVGALRSSM